MTLIIAIKDKSGISIGGDRLGSNLWTWSEMIDEKVFSVGDIIFGICGSFRVMNILQYHFTAPERGSKVDAKTYMYKYVLEEIKKLFNEKNISEVEKNLHDSYPVLIGYEWDIYLMQQDFSMLQHDRDFMTIWSGSEVANGYLEASYSLKHMSHTRKNEPRKWREINIRDCILATQKHCFTVHGVGAILSQDKTNWLQKRK